MRESKAPDAQKKLKRLQRSVEEALVRSWNRSTLDTQDLAVPTYPCRCGVAVSNTCIFLLTNRIRRGV